MDNIAINCTDFTEAQKKYVQDAFCKMRYKWLTPGYHYLDANAYYTDGCMIGFFMRPMDKSNETAFSDYKFLTFNELMELADCPWRMADDGTVVNINYTPAAEAPSDEIHSTLVDRTKPRNKYDREILPSVFVDVYDVLSAFKTDSPAVDHAVKKLLAPGKRGHKSRITDLKEAIASIESEIAKINEWSE